MTPGRTRDEALAKLRPGNFQGTPPRGRSHSDELAAIDVVDDRWFDKSRYRRLARVLSVDPLTTTGTFRVSLEVTDGEPFRFDPGQFVGVEAEFAGRGFRRSPYCILSDPSEAPRFDLLVRAVSDGPLSLHLARLRPGDDVVFRGPTGRSMVPRHADRELVLMATGTGVAPLLSLARHLLATGYPHRVSLWWGLRLVEDICLLDQLDDLVATFPQFSYEITLTQPPPDWTGLRGRITETVPPKLTTLGGKRFYLVGNGAMIEEMTLALSDLGVDRTFIYQEAFFNARHKPDPRSLEETRSRFVAHDLFSPGVDEDYALLRPERPLTGSRRVTAPPPR